MKKPIAYLLCIVSILIFTLSFTACGEAKIKLINISLAEQQYAVAVAKGNDKLREEINAVLEELISSGVQTDDGKVTFSSIYNEEVAAIKNNERLPVMPLLSQSNGDRENEFIIACDVYSPPFAYIVDTSFGGIDIRIAKIIADRLNKTLVVLYMDYADVLSCVERGDADAAISAISVDEEKKNIVDFSTSYYTTHLQIAVAASDRTFNGLATKADVEAVLKDLHNVKAGATNARPGHVYLSENFPHVSTTPYTTIIMAVRALANGEIGIACGDRDLLLSALDSIN